MQNSTADHYASRIVSELVSLGWSRPRAINAVQGDERYVRNAHLKSVPAAFVAGVIARSISMSPSGMRRLVVSKASLIFRFRGLPVIGD